MYRTGKYKIIGVTALLMAVSLVTWALQQRYLKFTPVTVKKAVKAPPKVFVYDEALLAKFQQITARYDSLGRNDYVMAGIINMVDKADTAGKLNNVSFLVCKQGSGFYYKLGRTETINADGLCLFIDHAARKIILSPQQAINYEQGGPKMFTDIAANLKAEEYNMSSVRNGADQTITFINETHISCKQYSMTFDTARRELRRMYLRFTNFQEPSRKDKEKVLDIRLSEFDGKADLKKYLTKNEVVNSMNGSWYATERFKDYELMLR